MKRTEYTYYVIFNQDENGNEYSQAWRVPTNNNLLSVFSRFKDAKAINACKTFKEAKATANAWNESSLKNGRYMFSNDKIYPQF